MVGGQPVGVDTTALDTCERTDIRPVCEAAQLACVLITSYDPLLAFLWLHMARYNR